MHYLLFDNIRDGCIHDQLDGVAKGNVTVGPVCSNEVTILKHWVNFLNLMMQSNKLETEREFELKAKGRENGDGDRDGRQGQWCAP